jgi:hypothetical protein
VSNAVETNDMEAKCDVAPPAETVLALKVALVEMEPTLYGC